MYYVCYLCRKAGDCKLAGEADVVQLRLERHDLGHTRATNVAPTCAVICVEEFSDKTRPLWRTQTLPRKSRRYLEYLIGA